MAPPFFRCCLILVRFSQPPRPAPLRHIIRMLLYPTRREAARPRGPPLAPWAITVAKKRVAGLSNMEIIRQRLLRSHSLACVGREKS